MADAVRSDEGWRVSPADYAKTRPAAFAVGAAALALRHDARWMPAGARRLSAAKHGQQRCAAVQAADAADPDALLPALQAAARRAGDNGAEPECRQVARSVRAARLCGRRLRRARHRRQLRHARQLPLAGRARGLPRDRRLDRAAGVVRRVDRIDGHLLRRRRSRLPRQHRPPRREGRRAAVCRVGHLFRPLLSRRAVAQPPGRDLRRADDRARSRSPRPAGQVCLLQGPQLRWAAARR